MNSFRHFRIFLGLIVCIIFSLPSISAHTLADKEKRDQARKEMKSMFAEFAKKEILPSMRQWKSSLDNAMSPQRCSTLNALGKKAKRSANPPKRLPTVSRRAWKDEDYDAHSKSIANNWIMLKMTESAWLSIVNLWQKNIEKF